MLDGLQLPFVAPTADITCGAALAPYWLDWALTTLVLALACYPGMLARFKAALWASLVCVLALNVIWIQAFFFWVGLTSGPFRAALQVSLAGAAIFEIAGISILFSGSAYAYAASRAGMDSLRRGGGAAAGAPRARRPARAAFAALQAGAWAAEVVVLVGLVLSEADGAPTPAPAASSARSPAAPGSAGATCGTSRPRSSSPFCCSPPPRSAARARGRSGPRSGSSSSTAWR